MKQEIDKQQFISLIGGRVCNPRQQHALAQIEYSM